MPSDQRSDAAAAQRAYRARRAELVRRRDDIREGPGYLYRPGQLVLSSAAAERFRGDLERAQGQRKSGLERLDRLDRQLWTITAPNYHVPDFVAALRRQAEGDPDLVVRPNHVFFGEPVYHGGPGAPPRLGDRLGLDPAKPGARGCDLAVLDTGPPKGLDTIHPDLAARLRPDSDDVDELVTTGPELATQAGHATFIAGLVARLTPELIIDPAEVLDPDGVTDDARVTLELLECTAPVINLSLGGYTDGDTPPPLLEAALAGLDRERVVVAAAGNNGSTRPFWPAAFKQVVAVAALDTTVDPWAPATFSNRGAWVDVCAPGVDLLSTYVPGIWHTGSGQQDQDFSLSPFASWSGTSFAAPLVAALVASQVSTTGSARRALHQLLARLDPLQGEPGLGLVVDPGMNFTRA